MNSEGDDGWESLVGLACRMGRGSLVLSWDKLFSLPWGKHWGSGNVKASEK